MQAFLDSGCRICDGWESLMQPSGFPVPPRPASGVTLSTWNTCSSTGLSPEPRTPRGTRPCTSAPSTIRSALAGPARALLLPPAPQPPCALCSVTVSFIRSFMPSFIQQVFTEHLPLAEDQVVSEPDSPSVRHAFPLQSRAVGGRSQGIQVPLGA